MLRFACFACFPVASASDWPPVAASNIEIASGPTHNNDYRSLVLNWRSVTKGPHRSLFLDMIGYHPAVPHTILTTIMPPSLPQLPLLPSSAGSPFPSLALHPLSPLPIDLPKADWVYCPSSVGRSLDFSYIEQRSPGTCRKDNSSPAALPSPPGEIEYQRWAGTCVRYPRLMSR